MTIGEAIAKNAAKMVLDEYDDVVEAFPMNAPIEPVHVSVLPGALAGCHDVVDAHILYTLAIRIAIDVVPVSEQEFRCGIPWEGLRHPLRCPFRCGIRRHVSVNDLAPGVAQYNKHEEQLKPNRCNLEEICGTHLLHVFF